MSLSSIYRQHLLPSEATVLDALKQLNALGSRQLVLLVVGRDNKIVGTVTDGDIRRALVGGCSLEDPITGVMHAKFAFVRSDDPDMVEALSALRRRRIRMVPCLDSASRLTGIIDLQERRSCLPVDAVIMAGGKGERLRPLTNDTPKPLLPLGGKAIIDHNIDRLTDFGIDNINITVNYLKEKVEAHIDKEYGDLAIRCVAEPSFLGTIGSVRLVPEFRHDSVLVINSDIYTNIDLEDFYLNFKHSRADMCVAAIPYTVAVPYGIMDLDGDRLCGITEKPTFNYYANGGIYLLRRECISLIPEGVRFDATELIDVLVAAGKVVTRFPVNGTWIDIGSPQEYRKAVDLAMHGQ